MTKKAPKMDDVLRKMLQTKPEPHQTKKKQPKKKPKRTSS
jgi:hypothetical protein